VRIVSLLFREGIPPEIVTNDSPRPEGRGIVVLQGMDCMRVHTPTNKALLGSKRPEGRGMDPLANQQQLNQLVFNFFVKKFHIQNIFNILFSNRFLLLLLYNIFMQ
jgi:hypothetical protein